VTALIIMAWNHYRGHRKVTRLLLPSPLTLQNYPEPK